MSRPLLCRQRRINPKCSRNVLHLALSARGGFVVISVMVVIVISLALFGVWARAAVRENRRAGDHQLRLQATRLAESGLRRGLAQRNASSDYTGETWFIP